jgi:hypothetical protein
VAVVDDLREEAVLPVHYLHTTIAVEVSQDVEPDLHAEENWEHTGLGWHTLQEVTELSAEDKIYPPHAVQVKIFLAQQHQYAQISGLK